MTWADWTGLVASIACGIHCAAMPLLLSYLPSFGLNWLAHEGFHQWMTMLCFIFAASAFIPGWRKHKSLVPALSGLIRDNATIRLVHSFSETSAVLLP